MSDVQTPPSLPPQPFYATSRKTEGTAIASMVLGIIGVTSFPIVPSIIALVLGYSSRKKIREHLFLALRLHHCHAPNNSGFRFIVPGC